MPRFFLYVKKFCCIFIIHLFDILVFIIKDWLVCFMIKKQGLEKKFMLSSNSVCLGMA